MNTTFHITTFGCQMNVNDSEWLARSLRNRGFEEAPIESANVVILATCSVREKPELKVYQALRSIAKHMKDRPHAFTVVTGCVAQQIGAAFFERFEKVRLVVGTDGISQAPDAIVRLVQEPTLRLQLTDLTSDYEEREAALPPLHEELSHSMGTGKASPMAYVNIMQGCDNYCAYCIVPYTRGPQKSRTLLSVMDECKALLERGVREITLLGQNVNAYGMDGGVVSSKESFADVLRNVAALPGLARLRFITPHPKDFSPETVALFAELPNLCPRLHLPMQAGSDNTLAAMGRKYTRADYMDLVQSLRRARPDIALSSDIIVGFPGETEQDFAQTLSAVQEVGFMSSFSFCYSDRPGTAAEKMPNKVELAVQKERLAQLQSLQDTLTQAWLKQQVGKETELILESPSRKQKNSAKDLFADSTIQDWKGTDPWGHTVNVEVQNGYPGYMVPVTITAAKRHTLVGRVRSL